MISRAMQVGLCIAVLSTWASAQTKISGTANCNKPDVQQKDDISDHPGHARSISQSKCAWTKAIEVGGVKVKEGVTSGVDDNHGGAAHSITWTR